MQKDFPTNSNYNQTCTIRGHEYTNEFTSGADSLGITDYPEDYYLGWIRPENLPNICKTTRLGVDVEDEENVLVVAPPTYNANIPFGYCMDTSTGLGGVSSILLWESTGGTPVSFRKYFRRSPRFINKFYPEYYGTPLQIELLFNNVLYNPVGEITHFNNVWKRTTIIFNNYNDLVSFANGTLSKTVSVYENIISQTFYFQLTGTDFSDGTFYASDLNGTGYECRFFLTGICISGMYLGYTNTTEYTIMPMFKHTMNFEFNDSSYNRTITELKSINQAGGGSWLATVYDSGNIESYYDYEGVGSVYCGAPPEIVRFSAAEVASTALLQYKNGVVLARIDYNNHKYVAVYTTMSDIMKYANLYVRNVTGACISYISGTAFATYVNGNDEFTVTQISGNIEDNSFRNQLREWQYVDLEYDPENPDQGTGEIAYDPDDMPPYEPVPPTPEPGDEGHNPDNPELSLGATEDVPGDMIEEDEHRDSPIQFPVSAFMTQYVLTASDVYNMGRTLWSGMGDSVSQMASNFVKTYTSTGTINIASLMDFFVSVKCFPFDMTNIAYGWQAPAMTVGTGAVPILNSSVWVLGVSTYIVDCGTVATTDKAFKLGVNSNAYDFRNYVNCTISCFLPFCGTVELNPADVFPYTLSCKYFVDMLSGSCTAVIWSERPEGYVPVASKTGQIGKIVPISATNVMGVVGQAISGVSNIFQTVGEVVISAAKRRALGATQAPINEASKNKEYLQEMANYNKSQTDISNKYSDAGSGLGVVTGAVSGIGNLMTRNGVGIPSLGAGVGLEAMHISERPYIVIRRLNYSSPNNYAHTTGFATTDGGGENNKSTIGSYSGWTVFQNPDLSGIVATKEELDEIKMLLETGVYL